MHVSVLLKETLEYLDPKPNENFVDATIGFGGHSIAILKKNGANGKVLGIELDPEMMLSIAEALGFSRCGGIPPKAGKFQDRLILVQDSYTNLKEIVKKHKFGPVAGILFDFGMSSWHLEKSKKGFSFKRNEMLDMRFNPQKNELTAQKILNEWSEKEIEKILKEYGEERLAKSIAKEILSFRKNKKIKMTFQLNEIIKKAIPFKALKGRRKRIHFATKTFMALRIAVNNELENIIRGLSEAYEVLEKGGRIITISFHSLEDRICKNFFKEKEKANMMEILTKKPIKPAEAEIKENPRSRSAILRAAIKV